MYEVLDIYMNFIFKWFGTVTLFNDQSYIDRHTSTIKDKNKERKKGAHL